MSDTARLQSWLAALGHDIAVDGIPGPKTDATLRRAQRELGVKADGIAGPKTWAALTAHVEALADSQMEAQDWLDVEGWGMRLAYVLSLWEDAGARELDGEDRGPWVRAICRRAGVTWTEGVPWCGIALMAADAVVRDWTGMVTPDLLSPSCDTIAAKAKALGWFRQGAAVAQPGDLVLTVRGPGDWSHVAVVVERHDAGDGPDGPRAAGLRVISGNSGDRVRTVSVRTVGLDTVRIPV